VIFHTLCSGTTKGVISPVCVVAKSYSFHDQLSVWKDCGYVSGLTKDFVLWTVRGSGTLLFPGVTLNLREKQTFVIIPPDTAYAFDLPPCASVYQCKFSADAFDRVDREQSVDTDVDVPGVGSFVTRDSKRCERVFELCEGHVMDLLGYDLPLGSFYKSRLLTQIDGRVYLSLGDADQLHYKKGVGGRTSYDYSYLIILPAFLLVLWLFSDVMSLAISVVRGY